MKKKSIAYIALRSLFLLLGTGVATAQNRVDLNNRSGSMDDGTSHWAETGDSVQTVGVPIGLKTWKIEPRFGIVQEAEPDTLPHLFQNEAFTSGLLGHYNYLGNLGSPRVSRILSDHYIGAFSKPFIFEQPYDFFLTQPEQLLFTNTKSPITNITYHECGNKQNGEDRIRALFATNVNKRLGFGFKLDYLYGRGYYDSQSTAHFNGTLWGSYLSDAYQLHAMYYANHLKNAENGGIENDDYVTRPETFPSSYSTADMPTRLTKTWNKLNVNTFYLTHRYNWGIRRYRDEEGNIVNVQQPRLKNKLLSSAISNGGSTDSLSNGFQASAPSDSLSANSGQRSEKKQAAERDTTAQLATEFIPVASMVHTFRMDHNNRRFLSNLAGNASNSTYFNEFYLPGDSANDYTGYMHIENTLALELREGFNKWVKSGLKLYARHDFNRYTLPDEQKNSVKYVENYITLGAELLKEQGRFFHYNLLGEMRTSGKDWGEFNVSANARFNMPLWSDTLRFNLFGNVRGEKPTFYYNHYHARNAWWDNSFDQTFRARVGATIGYKRTRLSVNLETLQNYAYIQEHQTPYESTDGAQLALYGLSVEQTSKNIQLLSATLNQDFTWGILNWENELTAQLTSDKELYPLPLFSAYSNLYLLFRVARVLRTELGADVRYFTSYDALTYSPIIGQFVVQDPEQRVQIGNYPIVNVYANFHLKNTRFYVMASHVNYSSGSGKPFLVPHYPLNRMVLRLGISWNFFN